MSYFLQLCGLSDPLGLFYLEQQGQVRKDGKFVSGIVFAGFRPFQLDDLLEWASETAKFRCWDCEAIQRTVINVWMDRADLICQWQKCLREEPSERMLVAALGTPLDWERRCEQLLAS